MSRPQASFVLWALSFVLRLQGSDDHHCTDDPESRLTLRKKCSLNLDNVGTILAFELKLPLHGSLM